MIIKRKKYKINLIKRHSLLSLLCFCILFCLFNCKHKDTKSKEITKVNIEAIPFEDLLDSVQKRSFNYFWDFAEPISGLARERSQKDSFDGKGHDIITIGGSGFGLSCFPIAVNRGWITKEEAIFHLKKVLTFLEKIETYHGAYSHWYIAKTGKTKPFSGIDDGGDIVETAFLIQGLLINRQFFSENNSEENELRNRITKIWENVEWDWYTQGNKSITWHWSKTHDFKINLNISGWNEALIVYILAASSPSHSISKEVYSNGWTRNGDMYNGKTFYNHKLYLGEDLGGPLFLAQYSFIGLDPRGLKDEYVENYFEQNRNHTLINYEYCKSNPNNFKGYSDSCWGLTASDNHTGYSAHHPGNDLGIITPTAALSSFPYTPIESKKALEHFYYDLNHKLWGQYGFYDAFSEHHNWVADGYLAIDQGPIIAMIENYRTQLLWNLFMQDLEIQNGLNKLGFSSPII